jgi:CubicO group peptidase (beta-lactamase class C family)
MGALPMAMRRLRLLLLIAGLGSAPFCAASPPAALLPSAGSPAEEGFSTERLQRLHRFIGESTGPRGYLGAVTLIARDGKIVDSRAYGHRDLARSSPMREDSIFRVYSMTKAVTSVAVLQLVEKGKLGLDDPVSRHLPEFAAMRRFVGGTADAPQTQPAQRPISIRQLLTHTAGFATGGAGYEEATRLLERADLHGSPDLKTFASRLAQVPLATEPGTRFKYDGTGIEVLARLVEVVSGESFDTYLQRHILAPLKMRDTGFTVGERDRHRIVDITRMGSDGQLALDHGPSAQRPGASLNPYPSGAGGLYSTAGDYARFCQMLLNGGRLGGAVILERGMVEQMMRNQLQGQLDPPVNEFNAGEGFGFGGYVVLDPARRGRSGSVGTFGWSGAASTTFTVDRERKLIAILLLQHLPNGENNDLPRIAANFYDLVYRASER